MLTDGRTDGRTHGRTDGRTDDGRKVITIAHPEQSSGELKIMNTTVNPFYYMKVGFKGVKIIKPCFCDGIRHFVRYFGVGNFRIFTQCLIVVFSGSCLAL